MGIENKKNASLTIRLESKTKKDLKNLAKNKGLTISELVNKLLLDQLEREEFKNSYKDQLKDRSNLMEEKIKNLKEKLKW